MKTASSVFFSELLEKVSQGCESHTVCTSAGGRPLLMQKGKASVYDNQLFIVNQVDESAG